MRLGPLTAFIPHQWLPLILVAAGLAWIVGAHRVARAIAIFVVASLVLPPMLAPLVQMVPQWVLWLLALYGVFLVPFAAVSLLQTLVAPALGRRTASEAAGHWAAYVGRVMFAAPFKLASAVIRLIAARVRR